MKCQQTFYDRDGLCYGYPASLCGALKELTTDMVDGFIADRIAPIELAPLIVKSGSEEYFCGLDVTANYSIATLEEIAEKVFLQGNAKAKKIMCQMIDLDYGLPVYSTEDMGKIKSNCRMLLKSVHAFYDMREWQEKYGIMVERAAGLELALFRTMDFNMRGKKTVRIIYGKSSIYTDSDGCIKEYTSDLFENLIAEYAVAVVSGLSEDDVKISVKPRRIYDIIGKINLESIRISKRSSMAEITNAMKSIGEMVTSSDKEQALVQYYDAINRIADKPIVSLDKPLLLVSESYLMSSGALEGANIRNVPIEQAIWYMARRNGSLITNGNPLFNEATLRDSAVWYLIKLCGTVLVQDEVGVGEQTVLSK